MSNPASEVNSPVVCSKLHRMRHMEEQEGKIHNVELLLHHVVHLHPIQKLTHRVSVQSENFGYILNISDY